jgi:hypothetical protein
MLNIYGFGDSILHKTPIDSRAIYTINIEEINETNVKEYQAMISSLLYLTVYSRPDILYAVVKLSQFYTNPSSIHLAAVKRIFRYLRLYPDLGITYLRDGGDQPVSYTNAN